MSRSDQTDSNSNSDLDPITEKKIRRLLKQNQIQPPARPANEFQFILNRISHSSENSMTKNFNFLKTWKLVPVYAASMVFVIAISFLSFRQDVSDPTAQVFTVEAFDEGADSNTEISENDLDVLHESLPTLTIGEDLLVIALL